MLHVNVLFYIIIHLQNVSRWRASLNLTVFSLNYFEISDYPSSFGHIHSCDAFNHTVSYVRRSSFWWESFLIRALVCRIGKRITYIICFT